MKLPVLSGKEVIGILLKNGFVVKRQKGSHVHLIKVVEGKSFHVTVPVHGNKDLNLSVLKSIIRHAGFDATEFAKLL